MGKQAARLVGALVLAIALVAATAPYARAQFQLGLQDPGFGAAPASEDAQTSDAAMRVIDGSVVRVAVYWSQIAPAGTTMPAGFSPSDPGDPHYHWSAIDAAVRSAAALHARVLLTLLNAPAWAQGPHRPAYTHPLTIWPGAWDPSPSDFSQFAHAAAIRYSGRFPDPLHPGSTLPRVGYWEIWNEPNLPVYLAAPNLVEEYRSLLNAGYAAIKSVDKHNTIVSAGLAPVSFEPPLSLPPLTFAARLLCLHRVGTRFLPNRSCPQRAEFDVFAMHPYTLAATPTKHAYAYGNVLVGDMGKIAALMAGLNRFQTARPRMRHQLWVTEWAWYTNPPDTLVGDRDPVAARYVAYSLYEMWRSGTDLVVWQNVIDRPSADRLGGGLYTASGAPKLMLRAFAFPVVAAVRQGRGLVWGRAPVKPGNRVVVQREVRHRWVRIGTARTGSGGVFEIRFRTRRNGLYRARVIGGPTSLPYNSTPIPPRRTHALNSG